MNKATVKELLQFIDDVEINGISLVALKDALMKQTHFSYETNEKELEAFFHFLLRLDLLKQSTAGIDLVPCAAVFVRSPHHSLLESLALLELTLKIPYYRECFFALCDDNEPMPLYEIRHYLKDDLLFDLFLDSSFYEQLGDTYRIQPNLLADIRLQIKEYEEQEVLLSTILCAHYADHLIFARSHSLSMRNEDLEMIDYPLRSEILRILPVKGIPKDREVTRGLQAFYKDTLFHEFDHRCPLRHAEIPHLLIASHIRPFRDCAHIYETIDYQNGILLCKNHDFLFDQGYFSFLENGQIIFSEALLKHDLSHYQLDPDYRLPIRYMTDVRKQFLAYHLNHIFNHEKE